MTQYVCALTATAPHNAQQTQNEHTRRLAIRR
jgi:hypothetical protein